MSEHTQKFTGPERAEGLLQTVLRKRRLLEQVSQARVLALWPKAVGSAVAGETRPESLDGGMLTVLTRDSIQSHALQSRSHEVIRKLNTLLGEEAVKRIRFRVAGREVSGTAEPDDDAERLGQVTDEELETQTLTDAERAEIEGLVGLIANHEVRDSVRRSLEVHYRSDKVLLARGWVPCERCGALLRPGGDVPICSTCRREGAAERVGG